MARIEDKRSFKAINFDDADEYLDEGDTRGMLNVRVGYSESGDDGIITNVKGTVNLFTTLSFSLPAGTNKCIATCPDDQNNRLIWLNYNSSGNHGIYCYNNDSNTIQTILASSTLNFSNSIIHSIDILDNNLVWTDNNNRPRAINVTSALAGDLGVVTIEEQINDAKVVPMFPPVCTTTVTFNADYITSLKSFQFIYRYVFIDGEKGAWSTVSKLVPTAYKDEHIEKITLNVTACELFTKVELRNIIEYVEFASREFYTLNFNQFLRISTSNLVASGGFVDYYDTESKTPLDTTTDTNIPFYKNPIKAGSVCFQNDRKFYADCTEGYDAFNLSPSLSGVLIEVTPASGGIPYLSDCDTHVGDRYLKPDSEYSYSVEFHDKYGIKSGAIDLPALTIKTQEQLNNNYKANILQFKANLASVGSYPSWADKFEILRSDNKTVTYFVQGRANRVLYCNGYDANNEPTYINSGANASSPNVSDSGAIELHIDISNWTMYGTNIGYTWTEGDRLTFLTLGGATDVNSSSVFKSLKIKELRGSLLIVDCPQAGRTNLNHASIADTTLRIIAGLLITEYGTLSRFIVGDNGIALYSRFNQLIYLESPPGAPIETPLTFPFAYTGIGAIPGFPTISNHLYGSRVNYEPEQNCASIDIFIVGSDGFFIRGNLNPQTESWGSWNTADTGVTQDLNALESSFTNRNLSDFVIVGDAGVILHYNATTGVFTRRNSGTSENLNYVSRSGTSNNIIVVGNGGTILRSTDNSVTWTKIVVDNCQNLNGVYFKDTYAIAVGDEGLVLYSSDSGLTWEQIGIGTIYNLNSVDGDGALVTPRAYIAGDNGYVAQFNLSAGTFTAAYSSGTTKDINFLRSYGTSDIYFDLGIGVGELDNLMDISFPLLTFTSYSSNVSNLSGSIYANYRAKIEVFSPKTTQGPIIYYETGDAYAVGANYTFNKGKGNDGDVFLIVKDFRGDDWAMPGDIVFSMTPNSLDTGGAWDKDLGRPNAVLLYPEKQQRRNIIRYSDKYVQDSRINGLSNFQEVNYEPIPNEFGPIRKLTPLETVLIINSERESATAYIDQTVFRGTTGQDVAATSDRVINNVRKLTGGFGCTNPESIVQYLGSVYFYSSNKGSLCRYNNSNGIFPISEYKARTYFYNLREILVDPTMVGGYEPKFKNYLVTPTVNVTEVLPNFNESLNGWQFSVDSIAVQDQPLYSVYCPTNENLYVSNFGSGTVSVINTNSNAVVATITVGTQPSYIIYNEDDGFIYVGNRGSSEVSIINPATNTVVFTVSVGVDPIFMVAVPIENKVFVTAGASNTVIVIDTLTHTIADSINISVQSNWALYVSSNNCVYISSGTSNVVVVINATTNAVVTTISTGSNTFISAYCPTNESVYALNAAGGSVSVIDINTNTVTTTITAGGNLQYIVYVPTIDKLYVCNFGSNNVFSIIPATNTIGATISTGTNPIFAAYSTISGKLYICNRGSNSISILDPATDIIEDTIIVGTLPVAVTYALDNGSLYISNRSSDTVSYLISRVDISQTIAFQEGSSRWISKYSFWPEKYGHVDNEMFSFFNGELWKHNASNIYNNFHGVQYTSQVNPVFNKAPTNQKNFTYLKLEGTKVWTANPMTTPEGQETFILSAHMEKIQNDWFGDIKQDINTPNMASTSEALFNGDFMQSNVLDVNLILHQASDNAQLRFATVYSNTINGGF